MTVSRRWIVTVAPVLRLAVSVLRLLAAGMIGTALSGLPTPAWLSYLSVFDSLGWQSMLGEGAAAFFDDLDRRTTETDVLEACGSGREADRGIRKITGEARTLLATKLNRRKREWWKDQLKPVLDRSGQVILRQAAISGPLLRKSLDVCFLFFSFLFLGGRGEALGLPVVEVVRISTHSNHYTSNAVLWIQKVRVLTVNVL